MYKLKIGGYFSLYERFAQMIDYFCFTLNYKKNTYKLTLTGV